MSRIIIPSGVRQACAEDPALERQFLRVQQHARSRLIEHAEAPHKFAVGGSSAFGRGPDRRYAASTEDDCALEPAISGCFGRNNQRLCDMQRVSRGVIVTGGLPFQLQMEPDNVNWFEPLAVRANVIDAENSDVRHAVLFTAAQIGQNPAEPTNDVAPVAPALVNGTQFDGWLSDDWQDPLSYATGVSWRTFSDLNNKRQLVIFGGAFFLPAATIVAVLVTVYGNAARTKPPDA